MYRTGAQTRFFQRRLEIAIGAHALRVVRDTPNNRACADRARQRSKNRPGRAAPHDEAAPQGSQIGIERTHGGTIKRRTSRRLAQTRGGNRIDDKGRHNIAVARRLGKPSVVMKPQIACKRED